MIVKNEIRLLLHNQMCPLVAKILPELGRVFISMFAGPDSKQEETGERAFFVSERAYFDLQILF